MIIQNCQPNRTYSHSHSKCWNTMKYILILRWSFSLYPIVFFTLSRGPAYRVPIPLFYFSSIYWDKHFNLIRITIFDRRRFQAVSAFLRSFDRVVFLRVSVLLWTVVWLVEHCARNLVWGVGEVAVDYLRLFVLSPCSLPSSHARPERVLIMSPRLAPNLLEMVQPKPVQRLLAWV